MAGSVLHVALTQIDVPERGSQEISGATFRALAEATDFWQLVDAKILRVEHVDADRFRLCGTGWVGQAVIKETTVNLTEKVSGSLGALLAHAAGEAFRLTAAEASASSIGRLFTLLVQAFLDRARLYVSKGVPSVYGRREEEGSLIGGTLDVPKTVRLRAGGFKHMAAYSHSFLHRDLSQNRVIAAALWQVEILAPQIGLEPADLSAARALAQFFGDARPLEVLQSSPEQWAREARRLTADQADPLQRDLLTLAGVVLSHLSFETEGKGWGRTPRSWFVTLENLFEDAVRKVFGTVSPPNVAARDGEPQRPIFASIPKRFRAHPDIVLFDGSAVFAIGDVKYKNWTGLSTAGLHSDLYQLLVHSSAFSADRAFLIFAHDEFEAHSFGRSATGVETWVFAVDICNLEKDLRRALTIMS